MVGYVLSGIRLLLLLFSFYGYAQILSNRYKLQAEFLLPIVFSFVGGVMFLSGILNILEIASVAILLIGIYCAVVSVKNKYAVMPFVSCGTVIMAITLGVLLVLTIGNKYTHYDNFSHWSTVLRQIITTDSFPNFDDKNIMFQSYPVGSAAFIYYFSKITGVESEWFCIFVQQVLTVSMLCSVFAFFKSKKVITVTFGLFTVAFILFADVEFTVTHDLLVDILLPVVAIAAMAICFYYRDDIGRYSLLLLPLTVFLVALKNSGLLFALLVIGYYLYRYIKTSGVKTVCSFGNVALTLSPFLTMLLWTRHVAYAFESGNTAKHSMSLQYYKEIFREKNSETIQYITKAFLKRVFSIENAFIIILLLLAVLLLWNIKRKINNSLIYECSAFVLFFFVAWMCGLLMTYILSMPLDEAKTLAGFDRYNQTGLIFCYGIILVAFGRTVSSFENEFGSISVKNIIAVITSAAVCIGCMLTLSSNPLAYDGDTYLPERRDSFEMAIENYEIDKSGNCNYFVIVGDSFGGYEWFMYIYVLNPNQLFCCNVSEFSLNKDKLDAYDCLVVLDRNYSVDDYLRYRFGSSDNNVYDLK